MMDATHTAALNRLKAFVPLAGRDYASKRNYDDRASVSVLSPYIRHRIITEEEVLRAVLARHSPQAAEKFIQEVFWRTYWKGWLEQRPAIWSAYRAELGAAMNRLRVESGLRREWEAACQGDTGIDCFDHWAKELHQTGYLHNHARMWFASIWVFTLRLPWTLGADFFLRHLLDGDPASNTLSWRWVAGLQTKGKTYLARPDNIAKYTRDRFHPQGLATFAVPLEGPPHPGRQPIAPSDSIDPMKRTALLITEEDMSPGWLLDQVQPIATVVLQATSSRSPGQVSEGVNHFVANGLEACIARYQTRLGPIETCTPDELHTWVKANEIEQLVTSYVPTGPTADALSGFPVRNIIRRYDTAAWPHATHGFFRFKENIPTLLRQLGGLNVT